MFSGPIADGAAFLTTVALIVPEFRRMRQLEAQAA